MGLDTEAKVSTEVNQEEIGNIDLSITSKKKFTIDKDSNRILELNTSDMNVIVRLKETYPKLVELGSAIAEVNFKKEDGTELTDEEKLVVAADSIKKVDSEMRQMVDYIFDSNVSEVCAPDGSMYDLFNGDFRFEIIIERLSEVYATNLKQEYKKINQRVKKHTSKYIK